MLHLRVICPPEQTDAVLGVLQAARGAAHVVVERNAAVLPKGDVIQADLARESVNGILDDLSELEIQHTGGVTLQPVELAVSDSAYLAEKRAPGDADDALIWQELLARTREESTLSAMFVAFLTIACLLAAVGVVTDSPVTIVGAMVVGPEFGPLAALAVALNRRKFSLAQRSLVALVVGFPFAMVVTGLGAWAGQALGWFDLRTIESIHQVDFIYKVGPFSLVVALLAGAAGMLALVSAKSAALVGVFISVTTVPAAGFAVVAATVGEWRVAAESTGQLAINMIGIVVAGFVVLVVRPQRRVEPGMIGRRL